ncbi:MAG: tryptophan--tRNA ligase [Candidatus Aureabacteria bacterium]|nr:tryptophan--tRNA ligase [Candidatus Auribacterota bacterium]
MAKKRVFSGIQPTGILHIGNYLGAIKNWVSLLDDHDCIFCIVDYHAITVPYEPAEMQNRIFDAALGYIACGVDPEKCSIFVQSDVPEHTELTWYLNTVIPVAYLERMTQFKDKSEQFRDNVTMGLLDYPVLQAADILIYKAEIVPVGEDQSQHLELTRDVARKFNNLYGETFPEPRTLIGKAARVVGLDGQAKMSKTLNNYISITELPEEMWKKLSVAVTDPSRKRRKDTGNPDICNIRMLHALFSIEKEQMYVVEGCRSAGIGCLDCKKILSDAISREMAPIRERYEQLKSDRDKILTVLEEGAKRCREIAQNTIREVKKKMGLLR